MNLIAKASVSMLLLIAVSAQAKTGLQFLEEAPPPVFKEGNTLLPLTRWTWPLSVELNIELADRWGYAIEIEPGPTGEYLDNPRTAAAHLAAIVKANPGRYAVYVNTRRVMFEFDKIGQLVSDQAWCRDADGNLILNGTKPVMKPYISDADARAIGQAEVARLERLKAAGVTASVFLNGAEYMPEPPGHHAKFWKQDPEVAAWLDSLAALPAGERVAAFASNKAKQEMAVRDALLSAMPGAEVIYYVTGDTRRGVVPEENRLPWTWPYRFMINGGTIPAWQFYYSLDGWWVPPSGSVDSVPLLATNSIAQGIEDRRPLSYNWITAGWSQVNPQNVSDDKRYMGFLKFLYTLGSVGNVAGYFEYPEGGFNGDLGASAPDWLRQIMLLSHAHAAFTHLENYLRGGDLLPGDGKHIYSVDLYGRPSWPHPSYEFATNEDSPSARVTARRIRDQQDWLIVAWAADGIEREVTVSIPELGDVTLLARAEGSLYRAQPNSKPILLDPVGMDPSRRIAEILAQGADLRPSPPSAVQVD